MGIPNDQYAFFRSFFQRTLIYRLLFCCLVALWLLVAFRPDPVPLALASTGSFVPATGVLTRFVDQQGTPLSLATIRLLCYDDSQNPPALTAHLLIKTAQHGKTLLPLPATCLKVAALQQVHQQPSGKAGRSTAYTVYNTSWQPGTSTLVPIDGDIVLRSDWRLVLFDVAAALEWEPAPGDAYVATLNQGLRLASAYLYDLTDGQMAFGPLTITTGGMGWDSADIRIRAANNYRPSAQVGGIVAVTTPYTSSIGVQTVYRPGAILMGRYWDGISAANSVTGAATQPAAYRTLVHEWLHYALFLYDEYQDNQATGRVEHFCTCADLPFVGSSPSACGGISPNLAGSAMSYHYTASELWHASANASCQKTDQQAVHGEPDWATLGHWSAIQGGTTEWLHNPDQLVAGPELTLVTGLFASQPTLPPIYHAYFPIILQPYPLVHSTTASFASSAITTPAAITLTVTISGSALQAELDAWQVQIYTGQPASGNQPARLVYQGTTTGNHVVPNGLGNATLLGVHPGDTLWLFADAYGLPAGRPNSYRYTGVLTSNVPNQSIQLVATPQSVQLTATPTMVNGQFTSLQLQLTSSISLTTPPVVQLCTPDAAIGCPVDANWHAAMSSLGNAENWTVTLNAPTGSELPALGVVRINLPGQGELIRWFQTLGGVGPGHRYGYAPQRDGLLTVDTLTPLSGTQNLVLAMPAVNTAAQNALLPLGFIASGNPPLDVKILLPGDPQLADGITPVPVMLTHYAGVPAPVHSVQAAALADSTFRTWNAVPAGGCGTRTIPLAYDDIPPGEETLPPGGCGNHNPQSGPPLQQLLRFDQASGHWVIAPVGGRSNVLGWLSTAPITQTGAFLLVKPVDATLGYLPQALTDPGPLTLDQAARFLVVLPASSVLTTSSTGLITYTLPEAAAQANAVTCTIGTCYYNAEQRTIRWQGPMQAGDLVFLSFEIRFRQDLPPSPQPIEVKTTIDLFDGQFAYKVKGIITLSIPPPFEEREK